MESLVVRQGVPDIAGWSAVSHGETTGFPEEQWPEAVSNTSQDADRVDSEPSDSATISQLDESSRKDVDKESAGQMHPDVESSTRSSSSPSEISRNELSIESPRTSVEDERSAGATTKEIASQDDSVVSVERSTTEHTKLTVVDQVEEDDSASHSSDPAADFEESDVDRSSITTLQGILMLQKTSPRIRSHQKFFPSHLWHCLLQTSQSRRPTKVCWPSCSPPPDIKMTHWRSMTIQSTLRLLVKPGTG